MTTASERQLNSGLLIIRLGLAAAMLIHALPRLFHGARAWAAMGREIHFLQAGMSAQIAGLILLIIEALSGLGLLSGYLFRVSATCLAGVFGMYFFNFLSVGYRTLWLYAAALTCVCIGMLLTGPGRFAVSVKIESK
jgi:uncharacterized membrane protein YphA (DoxX/SURF4 family)